MPPKAPESKAAKAAKAMAGGKKKSKVRARRCEDDAPGSGAWLGLANLSTDPLAGG